MEYFLQPIRRSSEDLRGLNSHIVRDFPLNERVPYILIKRMFKKQLLKADYFSDGDRDYGYIIYHIVESCNIAHVMYFAVLPEYRGKGMGSRMLSMFMEGKEGLDITLEVEEPSHAKNDAEAETRRRRIAFYQRQGLHLVDGLGMNSFGQMMHIMSTADADAASMKQLYIDLYSQIMGMKRIGWLMNRIMKID